MAEVRITMKRVFRKGFLCLEIPEDEGIREALKKILTSCREKYNDFVQVTIQPPYKPRTTGAKSQNHHLNGHIVQLCNITKHSYDEIKYCVKMKAVEALEYPYTIINGYLLPKSEHECNTEECAKLIEAAHLLAADWQIVLKE
ncbi:hypothetical protein [uncultured Treponema sp.]|uniref:hypothetical protein n=1 Tax=uncultured Treponema sp. TaxID=162155 RepID=UPI0027D9C848|nr:hypothetical protein [uncultured Treponema sp.]